MAMTKEEQLVFGKWVKSEREKLGLTQSELSRRLEIALGSISAIEVGAARTVGPKLKKKLEDFLGGTPPIASTTLGVINNHGLEHLVPMLRQIAKITTSDDYIKRVNGISECASCTKEEAAIIIFEQALKK